MPSPLRPDVSDVTAPHLIRCTHSKAAVELVGNIRLLHLRLFIGRRARLFADQPQLSHQMTHLEPAYLNAAFLQHVPDRASASRLTTLFKDLVHTAAQAHAIDIDVITSSSMSVVTGSRHINYGTDQIHRLMRAELVFLCIRSISSDIKSAVAFFKMAFSRSRRLIFLQFLDLLLFRRLRLALWGYAMTLLAQLPYPASQHGLHYFLCSAGFLLAVFLFLFFCCCFLFV